MGFPVYEGLGRVRFPENPEGPDREELPDIPQFEGPCRVDDGDCAGPMAPMCEGPGREGLQIC